jgi:hypothetical protein
MLGTTFKGKAVSRGVSLPGDLWEYLRLRAAREDRNVSTLVRRAIEKEIFARAEACLVDQGIEYDTEVE